MTDLETLLAHRPPTPDRPLLGLTILLVEDSRVACEAMRLMCLKSGARLRRAGSLLHARRHLATYRPGVVIVDVGLPDGDGCALIHELAQAAPSVGAILATSGNPDEESRALDAGAAGFLHKPISSLAAFQSGIMAHLPVDRLPTGPRMIPSDVIDHDPIALQDDLAHISSLLSGPVSETELDYAALFLTGVARCAGDQRLERAASAMSGSSDDARQADLARVNAMLQRRLQSGQSVSEQMHA